MISKESFDRGAHPDEIEKTGSIWESHETAVENRRKEFLKWVQSEFNPKNMLYAGSGNDKLPKNVLGEDAVIHISLEENKPWFPGGYFSGLGSGKKVEGDFLQAPFKEKTLDAVYIHDAPENIVRKGLCEFKRILKDSGILILDNSGWFEEQVADFVNVAEKDFVKIALPVKFNNPEDMYRNIMNLNESTKLGLLLGIVRTLSETKKLLKKAWMGKVIAQSFWVFAKKPAEEK